MPEIKFTKYEAHLARAESALKEMRQHQVDALRALTGIV